MIRAVPAVVLILLSIGRTAAAVEPEGESASGGFAPAASTGGSTGFGLPGQFVVSMGATGDEHVFFHKQSGGGWQLQLHPALDYFIASRVSVGGVVGYGHGSGGAGTGTNGSGSNSFLLGGRAGFNLDFNDRFGVWPLGGLFVSYESANHTSNTNTWVALFAPFMFHVTTHFFGGLGPSFQFNLSGPLGNQYGVDSFIGGWF